MTSKAGCLLALLAAAASNSAAATEPTTGQAAAPATALAASANDAPVADATKQSPPVPLDLKLGDALRYFPAAELGTPLDERLEEIIVKGQRMQPLRDRRHVPPGLFPSLKYATTHPLDAWRIVAPVPNFQIPDRNIDDPKDPPGSYRGKILEPGAIYD